MKRILDGYGLMDCTCGFSKQKPNCDGSHKQLLKSKDENNRITSQQSAPSIFWR